MSDGEWKADPISLTAPPGAGPSQNRFVMGEELPAELVAYYLANGYETIGGIVMYHPPDEYNYVILALSAAPHFAATICIGTRNAAGIVDTMQIRSSAGFPIPRINFGQFVDNPGEIFLERLFTLEAFGDINVYGPPTAMGPATVNFFTGSRLAIADSTIGTIGTTARIHGGLTGNLSAGPNAAASFTSAVAFGVTLPSIPRVMINLNSAAGPTSQWHGRAVNITTTGFTLFGFGPVATFTTNWQWAAFIQ